MPIGAPATTFDIRHSSFFRHYGLGIRHSMSVIHTLWAFPMCLTGRNLKSATKNMAYEFKATRRVEFSDTDMAGIMHYSNFFRFMETAQHGFYRSPGFFLIMAENHPPPGWPRGPAGGDYKKPPRLQDLVG